MTETGFCRNENCPSAASGEPIERYPGPGEYCPSCGERLAPGERLDAPAGVADHVDVHSRLAAALAAETPEPRWKIRTEALIGIVALVLVAVVAAAFVRRPAGPAATAGIRVCTSSMSARLAADVVGAFAAKNGTAPVPLDVRPADNVTCDVRFWADAAGAKDAVVGYDAIVVVLHPENPLTRLSRTQVRDVFAGRITDWSQLGRHPGRVIALAPDDQSDEAKRLAGTLFRDLRVDGRVVRMHSGAEITRRVASASGGDTIGLVPFSEAVPAKVIALGAGRPPSALSIGSGRYPLAVHLMVASDLRSPSAAAAAIIGFARSQDGQSIVARNGLVPKEGS